MQALADNHLVFKLGSQDLVAIVNESATFEPPDAVDLVVEKLQELCTSELACSLLEDQPFFADILRQLSKVSACHACPSVAGRFWTSLGSPGRGPAVQRLRRSSIDFAVRLAGIAAHES